MSSSMKTRMSWRAAATPAFAQLTPLLQVVADLAGAQDPDPRQSRMRTVALINDDELAWSLATVQDRLHKLGEQSRSVP
jgi:hypothetical protein